MKCRRTIAAAVVAAIAVTAGCSIANTAPDQVALHYRNGPFDSREFVECIGTGTRSVNDVNDDEFYYPTGQRTYKFSTDAGSDAAPLTTVAGGVELLVKGTITFTFNTSCQQFTDQAGRKWSGGKLQKFHETIGNRYGAFTTEEGTGPTDGWRTMLGVYVKDVVDRAVDNEALKYRWDQLYSDQAAKAAWERDVVKSIPDLIRGQAGEDFFDVKNVVLQKPDIPDQLKNELANKQAAGLRQETSNVDKGAAASWPGGIQAYLEYQRQLALNKAIESGKVQVLPVPQGSPVIVQPNAR